MIKKGITGWRFKFIGQSQKSFASYYRNKKPADMIQEEAILVFYGENLAITPRYSFSIEKQPIKNHNFIVFIDQAIQFLTHSLTWG